MVFAFNEVRCPYVSTCIERQVRMLHGPEPHMLECLTSDIRNTVGSNSLGDCDSYGFYRFVKNFFLTLSMKEIDVILFSDVLFDGDERRDPRRPMKIGRN